MFSIVFYDIKHAVLELAMFEENSKLQHFRAVTMNMLLGSSGTQCSYLWKSTYFPDLEFLKRSLKLSFVLLCFLANI